MLSQPRHGFGDGCEIALGRESVTPVRFAAGLYQFSQTQVYVNKGVGFGFRFRFGVRPEVAVMTLQPAA